MVQDSVVRQTRAIKPYHKRDMCESERERGREGIESRNVMHLQNVEEAAGMIYNA